MNYSLRAERRYVSRRAFSIRDLGQSLWELWRRRELLFYMTGRQLRGQYKQSILGYAWAFVNPLSQMIILVFVFSSILRIRSVDGPYPLFMLVGLLPWIFFSAGVSAATESVAGAFSMVTKVYFPREVLPTAAVFTKVVDLGFSLLILAGLMAFYGRVPSWTVVWVPGILVAHILFTLGVCYPLAALNLFFRDVRFLVGMALALLFYVTPIVYPLKMVPERYRLVFQLNPNSFFISAYRRVLLKEASLGFERLFLGLGIALATFLLGYYLFKRMEPSFADKI